MKTFLPLRVLTVSFAAIFLALSAAHADDAPYQATGIRIGEVKSDSAIIWLRLTANAERVGEEGGMPEVLYLDPDTGIYSSKSGRPDAAPKVTFPEGRSIDAIEGAVPGVSGKVRLHYRTTEENEWRTTDWQDVDPERDFTKQIRLDGLQSNTTYQLRAETESGNVIEGRFQTAPRADQEQRVLFTVSTGQAYGDQDSPDGFSIYPSMLALDPQFFVHTGDILYYDRLAKTLPLARWHWQRMYSLPTYVDADATFRGYAALYVRTPIKCGVGIKIVDFHRQVASYFIKDDHDTWMNDCWPTRDTQFMGEFTFDEGKDLFLEQVPMGDSTYRTVRWGKDIQVGSSRAATSDRPTPCLTGLIKRFGVKTRETGSSIPFKHPMRPSAS